MFRASIIVLVAAALFVSATAQVPGADDSPCTGVNEARYPCGRRCEERCNYESPATMCKGLMCLGFSCRCQNGFARNTVTGQCVRKEDCPPKN